MYGLPTQVLLPNSLLRWDLEHAQVNEFQMLTN